MKLIMIMMVAIFTMCSPVLAGFEGINDDTSLGIFNKIKCKSGLSCSRTGDGEFTLGAVQNQITATTTALTLAQCGSTVISAGVILAELPEASTVLGCQYTFVCGTADNFGINPSDGTDQILGFNYAAVSSTAALAPAAGDAIQCTDAGASLVMEATGANAWSVISVANGVWADIN